MYCTSSDVIVFSLSLWTCTLVNGFLQAQLEPCVLNSVLNVICELIIPHPSPMKVPSTLECVGIKLQLKQGVNS